MRKSCKWKNEIGLFLCALFDPNLKNNYVGAGLLCHSI